MKEKIAISISIVLAIVIAILFWQDEKREKEIKGIYIAMNQETRPFFLQIYELKDQIQELEKKASEVQTGTATTQFLITDLSTATYERIIQPMSDYSYPVVIGLSLREMPGKEGCMTAEQAASLAAQGWYFCYTFQPDEAEAMDEESARALSIWTEQVKSTAMQMGLNMEHAIYFPSGSYQEDYASVLKAQGIQTVIHHGELGDGLLTATQEDGLWYAGAVWWRGNEILYNKLSKISRTGGELVTLMGIDGSAKNSLQDWMRQFEEICSKGTIEVTDFAGMAAIQEENAQKGIDEAADYQIQMEEMNEQIEELEQQIEEIENRYHEKAGELRK